MILKMDLRNSTLSELWKLLIQLREKIGCQNLKSAIINVLVKRYMTEM